MKTTQLLKILSASVLVACADRAAPEVAQADLTLTGENGTSFNGTSFNGTSFNGASLNGTSFNGVELGSIGLDAVTLGGAALHDVWLDGSALAGMAPSGALHGTDFVGAHLWGQLSNGQALELRIDAIAPLTGANSDVLAYTVRVATDQGWIALCGDDSDGAVRQALAVAGTWNVQTGAWHDGGVMSFACRRASVAKCVELGYKPWLGLGDHQRACVRMLRADYCGDGTPYTVTGTPINLYDEAGVQLDTEAWPVDAEWGPDGALCFHHHRGGVQPACHAEKYRASCGSFASGALLIDEYAGP